jgi:hypothetical protein
VTAVDEGPTLRDVIETAYQEWLDTVLTARTPLADWLALRLAESGYVIRRSGE